MFFARVSAAIAFAIALAWVVYDPKFDSFVAAGVALTALAALFIAPVVARGGQRQTVSKGSTGIQAGGDVNIGGDSKNVGP